MKGHLQGFLTFLDLLAEGNLRSAELIAGRRFESGLGLQPAVAAAKVVKFPLTGNQKAHLFDAHQKTRVSIRN